MVPANQGDEAEEEQMHVETKNTGFDKEWIRIIKEAKALGFTIEEIRLLLKELQDRSVY